MRGVLMLIENLLLLDKKSHKLLTVLLRISGKTPNQNV